MQNLVGSGYIFIIDTENYAGNFERQMCGYMTGIIGECGVGSEEATQYAEDMGLEVDKYGIPKDNQFDNIVQNVNDDKGCARPASIWETPGWYNNGHGGNFRDTDDESKAIAAYILEVERYNEDIINRVKSYQDAEDTQENRNNGKWTKAAKEREINRRQNEIDEARKKNNVFHYPSYLSVAIFLTDTPNEEQIKFMKKRAYAFADNNAIKITGFRLLKVIPETYHEIEI